MATYSNTIYVQSAVADEKLGSDAPCYNNDPFVVAVADVEPVDAQLAHAAPGGTMQGIPVPAVPVKADPNWGTGLLGCGDDANSALEGCVCIHAQNSRQYNQLHYAKTEVEPITCLSSAFCDAVTLALTSGLLGGSWCLSWHNRTTLRTRYGIEGNSFKDACASFWCLPCVTCQNYREMSLRGEWSTGCCIKEPFAIRAPVVPTMGEIRQH